MNPVENELFHLEGKITHYSTGSPFRKRGNGHT